MVDSGRKRHGVMGADPGKPWLCLGTKVRCLCTSLEGEILQVITVCDQRRRGEPFTV